MEKVRRYEIGDQGMKTSKKNQGYEKSSKCMKKDFWV
jgi:hypothetical protein